MLREGAGGKAQGRAGKQVILVSLGQLTSPRAERAAGRNAELSDVDCSRGCSSAALAFSSGPEKTPGAALAVQKCCHSRVSLYHELPLLRVAWPPESN